MQRQNWEILLHTIFEYGGQAFYPTENGEEHPTEPNLTAETSLSWEEVDDAVDTLRDAGLATTSRSTSGGEYYYSMNLENSGYKAARDQMMQEREMKLENIRSSRQFKANLTIAIATIGLMTVTAASTIATAYSGAVIHTYQISAAWASAGSVILFLIILVTLLMTDSARISATSGSHSPVGITGGGNDG
jgi:hypothetical protein